jgi:hypothetical protein
MPILLRSWHFVPRRDTGNDFIQANDRLATVLAKPAAWIDGNNCGGWLRALTGGSINYPAGTVVYRPFVSIVNCGLCHCSSSNGDGLDRWTDYDLEPHLNYLG